MSLTNKRREKRGRVKETFEKKQSVNQINWEGLGKWRASLTVMHQILIFSCGFMLSFSVGIFLRSAQT